MASVACGVPKDCSEIQDIGLEESGQYYVIPTGSLQDPLFKVKYLIVDSLSCYAYIYVSNRRMQY